MTDGVERDLVGERLGLCSISGRGYIFARGQGRSGKNSPLHHVVMEDGLMCGIVGYVGHREAEPILVEGLRRLEYRGYDSAGVATLTGDKLHIRKQVGRIADLARHLRTRP